MRWLAGIFANALARRIAALLVAVLLASLGVSKAHAQNQVGEAACTSQADNCTQAQAYAACMTPPAGYTAPIRCPKIGSHYERKDGGGGWIGNYYKVWAKVCSAGEVLNEVQGGVQCQKPCTTTARPSSTVPRSPLSGSVGCNTGCAVTYRNNGDDTSTVSVTGAMCGPDFKNNCPSGTFWNGMMALCQPLDPTCPAGQVKKDGVCEPDSKCPQGMVAVQGTTPGAVQQGELFCKAEASECPAGTIKAPATGKCLPGEGQCAAGEAMGKDGTCKKDKNNDGKPDDEEGPEDPNKDSASGGDSCDSPPSCSGSAIACIQVKIQWRIDCNTRRAANISGGSCDAVPICTGKSCDAMEYAQLMQQWRATCALEKLAKKGTGEESTDGTDGNGNGVPDALEGIGDAASVGDGTTDVDGARKFGVRVGTGLLNQDNIFGGGSCPQPPSFKIMGATVSGSDFPYWCQAMAILRGLILIFGAFTALKILMGWGF